MVAEITLSFNFSKNFWRFELHILILIPQPSTEKGGMGEGGGGNLPSIEFCIVTF